MNRTLVLFDIDGTLIRRKGDILESLARFPYANRKAFGLTDTIPLTDYLKFNGYIDKAQIWEVVKDRGISRDEYEQKFPQWAQYAHEYVATHNPRYQPTEGSAELVAKLSQNPYVDLGVITGNVEPVGRWKLAKTGFEKYFPFGLFGGEADNRIELAKLVFDKARAFFSHVYAGPDITVVGDTEHDVRCAKAVAARAILILTGEANSSIPADAKPDLVVQTLADRRLGEFFH